MRQKREEKERWDQIMQIAQNNPQAAMAMQSGMPMYNMPMGGMGGGGGGGMGSSAQRSYTPQQADQSGNPYAAYGNGDRR